MYSLQPAKKNNPIIIILAIIGGLTLFVSACAFFGGLAVFGGASSANSYASSSPSTHHVVYKATTDRPHFDCFGVDATYEMPSGTAQKHTSVCDGSTSLLVDERSGSSGDPVYLSVQNGDWSARISCQIYVDGKLVYQTYSEGQYVIASCSGRVE